MTADDAAMFIEHVEGVVVRLVYLHETVGVFGVVGVERAGSRDNIERKD
ncbi:hypothetical protein [Rhizobium leguminosarum]|nr:hypothetical protein U8Q02_43480 [Rhizobium leguminosarum]